MIAPNTISAADREPFKEEPPVDRMVDKQQGDGPLNVKVLVNFAPQNSHSATLRPLDMNALVAILRSIAREPRIGKFSTVPDVAVPTATAQRHAVAPNATDESGHLAGDGRYLEG